MHCKNKLTLDYVQSLHDRKKRCKVAPRTRVYDQTIGHCGQIFLERQCTHRRKHVDTLTMQGVTLKDTWSIKRYHDTQQRYFFELILQHNSESAKSGYKLLWYGYRFEGNTIEIASNIPQQFIAGHRRRVRDMKNSNVCSKYERTDRSPS